MAGWMTLGEESNAKTKWRRQFYLKSLTYISEQIKKGFRYSSFWFSEVNNLSNMENM